ncbi:hypothetical protein [Corynebacterium glutamicum]|uniref:Uncharacterized protein n=1 Tax=Corynebacterium glutamicum (strain R) TaxID=340322 RepID=A0AB72VFA8_CORGB|nr:hypothetical protein [Corynebacterium glutamicum]BAQ21214.1 hypothetical protein cgR_6152 [Corynebacterium glutamicum R]
MSLSIESVLAAKGIHPKPEHLKKLESKWEEIEGLKGNLANINLDDADISPPQHPRRRSRCLRNY